MILLSIPFCFFSFIMFISYSSSCSIISSAILSFSLHFSYSLKLLSMLNRSLFFLWVGYNFLVSGTVFFSLESEKTSFKAFSFSASCLAFNLFLSSSSNFISSWVAFRSYSLLIFFLFSSTALIFYSCLASLYLLLTFNSAKEISRIKSSFHSYWTFFFNVTCNCPSEMMNLFSAER